MKTNSYKVGLFGIGLNTYWVQFEGLLDNLKKYQTLIQGKIESIGAEVVRTHFELIEMC